MTGTATWNFPRVFWTSNIVEMFERSAYYAMFISITLYLSRVVGYDDIDAAWIAGVFSAGMHFLPPFTGALADSIGFRKGIITAFLLLTVGYATLGFLPFKSTVPPALILVMVGGAFIKSIITGTVAKNTTAETRARGYSIFYGMVNIGSFLGKTFAYPMRIEWGVDAVNFYSAGLSLAALVTVVFFYRSAAITTEPTKSFGEVWKAFVRVLRNARLVTLIVIVTGFWIIQHQMYATMPKFVLRMVGEGASPEWISNVNPFVVVTSVVLITQAMRTVRAVTSMTVGMFLMPFSALLMASGSIIAAVHGTELSIAGLFTAHPVTVMMIAGIVLQGWAECFISPRFLEYFSLQAPKGEEGLYLGFGHLHSFLSSILGFGLSGYLLTMYCPDPATVPPELRASAYDSAHVIWYYFAVIGFAAGVALILFRKVTERMDARLGV